MHMDVGSKNLGNFPDIQFRKKRLTVAIHAQFVSNLVDFGMNVQGAMDAARFSKETFAGCDVNFEARIPEATRKELTALGHQIIMRGDFSSTRMGSGQAVERDFSRGVNFGASDPRKDGAAIAELRPFTLSR